MVKCDYPYNFVIKAGLAIEVTASVNAAFQQRYKIYRHKGGSIEEFGWFYNTQGTTFPAMSDDYCYVLAGDHLKNGKWKFDAGQSLEFPSKDKYVNRFEDTGDDNDFDDLIVTFTVTTLDHNLTSADEEVRTPQDIQKLFGLCAE